MLAGMDPVEKYNPDIWPGVGNLIVSEMAKRAWSMFKLYLSSVALEIGRHSNFDNMDVEKPALVDDEVYSSGVALIELVPWI